MRNTDHLLIEFIGKANKETGQGPSASELANNVGVQVGTYLTGRLKKLVADGRLGGNPFDAATLKVLVPCRRVAVTLRAKEGEPERWIPLLYGKVEYRSGSHRLYGTDERGEPLDFSLQDIIKWEELA